MWKEWFYYTIGERRVIILLLLIISVIVTLMYIESSSPKTLKVENNTLALIDSLSEKIKESEKKYKRDFYNYSKRPSEDKVHKKRESKSHISGKEGQFVADIGENFRKPKYKKQEKFTEGTLVDINTADTTILKKIPGIGSVISRSIVKYRDRLGGFYDINQLLEVKYVKPSLLEWFKLETGIYRKLKVNTDNIDVLKSHPYMGYYRAKAIIDYRKKRGKIENFLQISLLKDFSDKDIDKLKQYIDFQ